MQLRAVHFVGTQCSALKCDLVQCIGVRFSFVQCNGVHFNIIQWDTIIAVQLDTTYCSAVQYGTTYCIAVQWGIAQCSALPFTTVQWNTPGQWSERCRLRLQGFSSDCQSSQSAAKNSGGESWELREGGCGRKEWYVGQLEKDGLRGRGL